MVHRRCTGRCTLGTWWQMTAASRQAKTRRRQSRGLVNLRIDVPEHRFAKALIRARRLTPEEALRRNLMVRELEHLVEDFCDHMGVTRDWSDSQSGPYSDEP